MIKFVFVEMCIFDILKILMYDIYFKFIKAKYGEIVQFLMIDIDFFVFVLVYLSVVIRKLGEF